jgi:hypothetical protein
MNRHIKSTVRVKTLTVHHHGQGRPPPPPAARTRPGAWARVPVARARPRLGRAQRAQPRWLYGQPCARARPLCLGSPAGGPASCGGCQGASAGAAAQPRRAGMAARDEVARRGRHASTASARRPSPNGARSGAVAPARGPGQRGPGCTGAAPWRHAGASPAAQARPLRSARAQRPGASALLGRGRLGQAGGCARARSGERPPTAARGPLWFRHNGRGPSPGGSGRRPRPRRKIWRGGLVWPLRGFARASARPQREGARPRPGHFRPSADPARPPARSGPCPFVRCNLASVNCLCSPRSHNQAMSIMQFV